MHLKNFFNILLHWERWAYWVKYVPLYPAWLWYCLKARSFWFFTPSNPSLTFGGFEGESKKEMYAQLPPSTYPKSIFISPSLTFCEVKNLVADNHFNFPFAVKPDVGMMGFMFRKIDDVEQFKLYHTRMPVEYIVQELVKYPIEVSVFYYRYPHQQKGKITGFLKKDFLEVTGDGKATLEQLIEQLSPRAGYKPDEWKLKHAERLSEVIAEDEMFRLSWAANLSRGARLISLAHEKDDKLLKVFDDLSHYTKHFYYGRYDIKCASISDLKEGKNFSILEYNGSGAEPHHAYGAGNTLMQAHKIFLHHWKVLYKISKHNRAKGIEPWKFKEGYEFLRVAKKHFKKLRKLDAELNL